MKKGKTVFAVLVATLALSAICGVAHLRESSHRGETSPQLAKARFVGQGEAQRTVSSTGTIHDAGCTIHDKDSHSVVDHTNPKLDNKVFAQKTQKLQMPFIANNGQADEQVEFYAKTFGGTVFVTKDGEIVYALPKTEKSECRLGEAERTQQAASTQSKTPFNSPNLKSKIQNLSSTSIGDPKSGIALREEFVGARVKTISAEDPSITKVNYFKGSDPSKWKTNVSTYDVVSLGDVYDGIELRLKAYGNNVEKLFCVKPGADPEQIKISLSGIRPPESPFVKGDGIHNSICKWGASEKSPLENGITTESPLKKGARGLWVNEEGQLVAETELGPVKFTKPIAYQEIDGKRVGVECKYTIADCGVQNAECKTNPQSEFRNPKSEYGFKVASYDRTKDLIIDPLLASTFLGVAGANYGYSITLDTSGNVYVMGYTNSTDFPTTIGVYDTSFSGGDVFISKLDSGLTSLLASTYLGGSNRDNGNSITLDTSGNVYVTGFTLSSNFPTTSEAYDTSWNGGFSDVFVSKLNGGLTSLLASTYLGGSKSDYADFLILDTSGNVYLTGETWSTDFPTTIGVYDTSYNGDDDDVFVSKLDSGLTSLLASSYLGGSYYDGGSSLTLDTSGNVYVMGSTESNDFPTTSGAYDTSFNGDWYVFISKLDGELTSLLASTYLGGSDYDYGNSLSLDTSGNVYVMGSTESNDFPTTSGAYNTSFNGGDFDVFVSKLNSGLTSLLASTYMGGTGGDKGNSLTLDTSGNVYVTGSTESNDFPTTSGAYDTSYNGDDDTDDDVFVSKLNSELTSLLASTYLGGSDWDGGSSLTLDTSGNVYVAGATESEHFPMTSGAYDTSFNGGDFDVFVSKLDSNLSAPSGCDGKAKTVVSDTEDFELLKRERKVVTVTVTDAGGCPVADKKVSATVNGAGKIRIKISSSRETTDEDGKAAFTITAKKKTGNAKVIFKAGGVIKKIAVKVVKE